MDDKEHSLDGKESEDDLNWENRTLCSDESCIGVIGPDGRCKECGKPYEGSPGEHRSSAESDPEPTETPGASESSIDTDVSEDDLDWETRTLCSDESCIGVIGPDGRCKECGKPYEG